MANNKAITIDDSPARLVLRTAAKLRVEVSIEVPIDEDRGNLFSGSVLPLLGRLTTDPGAVGDGDEGLIPDVLVVVVELGV